MNYVGTRSEILDAMHNDFPATLKKSAGDTLIYVLDKHIYPHTSFDDLIGDHKERAGDYSEFKRSSISPLSMSGKIAIIANILYGPDQIHSNKKLWTSIRRLMGQYYDSDDIDDWLNPSPSWFKRFPNIWNFRSPYIKSINAQSAEILGKDLKINKEVDIEGIKKAYNSMPDGIDYKIIKVAIATGLRMTEIIKSAFIRTDGPNYIVATGLLKSGIEFHRRPVIFEDSKTIESYFTEIRKAYIIYHDADNVVINGKFSVRLNKLAKSVFGTTFHKLRSLYSLISYYEIRQADTQIQHVKKVLGHSSVKSSLHYSTYKKS